MSFQRPCPFCGGKEIHWADDEWECQGCLAQGPSQKESKFAWNSRPGEEELEADLELLRKLVKDSAKRFEELGEEREEAVKLANGCHERQEILEEEVERLREDAAIWRGDARECNWRPPGKLPSGDLHFSYRELERLAKEYSDEVARLKEEKEPDPGEQDWIDCEGKRRNG